MIEAIVVIAIGSFIGSLIGIVVVGLITNIGR